MAALHRRRDHLGQAVGFGIRYLQDARDVAHGIAGGHAAESHDIGHALLAVLVDAVLDDLFAAAILDVDIDVGHADAVRVQETFEQQVVEQGVYLGYLQGIGDNRAGGAAPARPEDNALVFAPADEVGDNQEIAVEAHLLDNPQLVISPLQHPFGQLFLSGGY